DDDQYELWLVGSGDADNIVAEYALNDHRIKPLGFTTPDKILELQNQATVLVNPRLNKHSYVRYSFPSKTVEYLATGKPVISHRLDCMGSEYEAVIEYVSEATSQSLRDK